MKLLFDHNLSPRLVQRLADVYPRSEHIYSLGLDRSSDDEVWRFALENNYVIVTKDADFNDLNILRGFPPKVIWIRIGNCPTDRIESALRTLNSQISAFGDDQNNGMLVVT